MAGNDLGPTDARLILEVMKLAAETAKTLGETARLQSETTAQLAAAIAATTTATERKRPLVGGPAAQTPTKAESATKLALGVQVFRHGQWAGRLRDGTAMVIDGRVGSVSVEMWEAMSDQRLAVLDAALTRIVSQLLKSGISGVGMGTTIQEELAMVGLVFAPASHFTENVAAKEWKDASDTALPVLVRIDHALENFRVGLGQFWYSYEMLRVVQRLMELRGFSTSS